MFAARNSMQLKLYERRRLPVMKNEMDKTITFSIREEERDRERKMLLRAVYDALSEKCYNPINQLV